MSNLPIEYCGIVMDGALSWNGFNLVGDEKSIKELKRLMHEEACAIDLRQRLKELEARRTVSGQEAAKWIHDLRRAHEYLDKGEPFFTGKDCAELADLIESLVAPTPERADAGKDAERYRWLREQDDSGPLFVMYGSNGRWGECGHSDIYGELLDKSIDEEIAKEAKE